jgi:hypothetical protein
MNLTQEKIKANAKKYFKTAEKHNFMTDELMIFLGEDFVAAPASTKTELNNAFDGGLIDHIFRVCTYAIKLNGILPNTIQVDESSLIKVCFLHQIGKAKLYIPCESEWHRKNQGKMYDFNNDLVSMKVGERSAYYALKYGVNLTEDEYSAIVFHDKDDEDKQAKWHNSIIGEILKMSNILAIKEEKLIFND